MSKLRDKCNNYTNSDSVYIHEFTLERYRKRVDDVMKWVETIENKASTLIAANGVIIALSVTLLNIIVECQGQTSYVARISLFPDWVLYVPGALYLLQLIFFIISMIFAYSGYRVSAYIVPDIAYLLEECSKNVLSPRIWIMRKEISELCMSKKSLDTARERKATQVKRSQFFLILGCIALSSLLLCFIAILSPWFVGIS